MVKCVVCMSVGTGGAEESDKMSLASALAHSLVQTQPDEIVFFVSKESVKTVDLISAKYRERCGEEMPVPVKIMLERVDDFYECFTKVSGVISERQRDGCRVFVDYTSGTKTMTMVMGVSSVLYHCTLLLTEGRRDENGRVLPGSERVLEQQLFSAYDRLLFDDVVRMFHAYRFSEALDLLERGMVSHEFRDVMISICRAFQFWDRFEYKAAETVFLGMNTERAKLLIPDIGIKIGAVKKLVSHSRNVDEARDEERDMRLKDEVRVNAKDKERRNLVLKYRMILADLLCNAGRRIEEGKYEDAVARLYRSVELVAQIKLLEKAGVDDLEGAGLRADVVCNLLPKEMQGRYQVREVDGKFVFGLRQKYELLKDLGPKYGWPRADEVYRGIQADMEKRNRSVLAHGITPVTKEEAEQIQEKVRDIAGKALDRGVNTVRDEMRTVAFPRVEWK